MAELNPNLRWRLKAGSYLGEISALCFLPLPSRLSPYPLLLAGSGSEILAYDVKSGVLLRSFHVFQGIRVHGISLRSVDQKGEVLDYSVIVYGERRVKLFRLEYDGKASTEMELLGQLPRFDHWVLDAHFLKEDDCVAVGLSDNSVALWDMNNPDALLRVKSSERCLLYSMRIWGDSLEALRIASGTIYNEIIVWKLIPQDLLPSSSCLIGSTNRCMSDYDEVQFRGQQYISIFLSRLTGHEGSIFRIAWSSDGSRLMSVSDDRRTVLASG